MEYVCKVGTPGGDVVEQTFSAPDETALRAELEQKGYYLFDIKRGLGLKGFGITREKVPNDLLMLFGQELAALLKAGLPLVQSIEVMLERQKHPAFKRSLTVVRDKVKSGIALSEAFRDEGTLYPPMLSASLIAGERSGNLEGVLRRFVQYVRLSLSLKKKAVAAAVYPIMLFLMMTVLGGIMMLKVIPAFQDFYADFDIQLPFITRSLMAFSRFLVDNLTWLVVGAGILATAWVVWSRRPGSGVVIDRFFLRVPYLGSLMRMYATGQLSRTLSALLSGGLPLVNAMEVSSNSIGNRALAASVKGAVPLVREGQSLTTALESTRMLDNLALEMVKVGEQTGALADMLTAVADFYDEELETRLATVMALVEPVMLVVMAVVVGGMVMSFYVPLFQAISALQGGR
jgi:type IV pilus assembly protein PilC